MAVLSKSTLLGWFDFGAPPITQFLNASNTYVGATDGTLIVWLAWPELHSPIDLATAGLIKDGPIGRYSYGRYLEQRSASFDYLYTYGDANQIAHYARAAWTMAVVFRPRVVNINQVLVSKRNSNSSQATRFSMRLKLSSTTLQGACASATTQDEVSIASAVTAGNTYIAYMSKTDGAALNIGIKQVDSGSWLTATSLTPFVTVLWSASYNMFINCQNTAAGGANIEWFGNVDYNQVCWWYSALTPAAIQAGIEDHFGIANPAGGSGGVSRARVVNA